ncbi:Methyltransferase domain-containing protein [Streptomyces zhaozhouensis]|uniref:Methyltransferase domain-containing protein n=1 Tax=Streptomyces zhaozhouensis TaxID=1300267 RepID=A0A286DW73_9ACTN|nr:class I SAM-dependent methyltransferase [Streptomyces zhaozhouensis]SOD62883.1 Methyltransferase domain-containing protein [Streptomyces zhaozhouensis]
MTQRPSLDQPPEAFWEELYRPHRENPTLWGARVNPLLGEVAAGLPPGVALDLGSGAGGDAIWLARHGWRVTAVDISATAVAGLQRCAREQELAHLVTAERHDLARTFPEGAFDLVSAQYLHTPFALPRSAVLRAAAHALRPGGRLLVVDHGSRAPWSWDQDPDARFPAPEEIHAELALAEPTWTVERSDAPRREATGPNGQTAVVTDHVLLLRRTPR